MAAITTRATAGAGATVKGSNLTNAEVDANLINLNDELFVDALPVIRPTLSLDFLNQNALDERVTFSRSSSGTYTDSAGLLRRAGNNVPRFDFDPATGEPRGLLVEEQRTNLLTYSDRFRASDWSTSSISSLVPNAAAAPDGSMSATLFGAATGAAAYVLRPVNCNSGITYTFSVYLRGVVGGETVRLYLDGAFPTSQTSVITLTTTWTRYTVSATCSVTTLGYPHILSGTQYSCNGQPYYAWGAQFEAGVFAASYIPSTDTFTGRSSTATFVGSNGLIQTASSGVARQQYNPLNLNADPFLLLEAQATNLLTYSEQVQTWAVNGTPAITTNAATAPDGNATADQVAVSVDTHGVYTSASVTSGATLTYSAYFKHVSGSPAIQFGCDYNPNTARIFIDVSAGTITGSQPSVISSSVTPVGNGWFRFSGTFVSTGTPVTVVVYTLNAAGTFLFWGAQLEAGSFATSYIPTVASQVTRAADTSTSAQTTRAVDVARLNSVAPWWNTAQGSICAEWQNPAVTVSNPTQMWAFTVGAAASNGSGIYFYAGPTSSISSGVSNTGDAGATNSFAWGTVVKGACGYVASPAVAHNICLNGGSVASGGTNFNVQPAVMSLGQRGNDTRFLNGWLRKLAYYPKRLTDTELRALTL